MADENVVNEEETPSAEEAPVVEPEAVAGDELADEPTDEPQAAVEEEPAEEAQPEAAEPDAAEQEAAVEAAAVAKRKRKHRPRSERRRRSKPKRATAGERRSITRLPAPDKERGKRPERQGTVVSAAMDKTIVVKVVALKPHPKYKKVVRRSTKFHAHDERNEASVGDVVRIVETRPLSATKRWRLAEIVEAAK